MTCARRTFGCHSYHPHRRRVTVGNDPLPPDIAKAYALFVNGTTLPPWSRQYAAQERAPFLQCVPTPISLLGQIADDVRQRCLGHLSGEVRALARPITEHRADPVNREIARPGRRERLAALRAGKYEIPNLLDTTSLQMTAAEMHGARHMQCPQMMLWTAPPPARERHGFGCC